MPFKPDKDARINLTGIETALYNYLYEIVFGIIKKYVKGNAQKELMDFFNDYIDLNYSFIEPDDYGDRYIDLEFYCPFILEKSIDKIFKEI